MMRFRQFLYFYAVVSRRISIGGMILCTGSLSGSGLLFFLSAICEDRISMASLAMTDICCPTVLNGITASLEIGELSNPMIWYVSGSFPYLWKKIFKRTFAWVSFGM